jgi:23S rRNA (guanine745-N1)-methyltransferase
MNVINAENLACPIDGERLESRDKQLICANGHTFDIARQGYVNLLPVQHKRSKNPGDSKEMVKARATFLDSGIYEPVAKKLVEVVREYLAGKNQACLMDAGCGEGYYLNYIVNEINPEESCNLSCIGLDISKAAIIEAAKRNKQISWIVGTNRQPPVENESVDVILCVFGFHSFEGFKKTLKPGGKIILVEPGADHLKELREIIYDEVEKSASSDLSCTEKTGYLLHEERQVKFRAQAINNDQVKNLLLMTPHLYRATSEGKEAANNVQQLVLTIDVIFRILEKNTL